VIEAAAAVDASRQAQHSAHSCSELTQRALTHAWSVGRFVFTRGGTGRRHGCHWPTSDRN